MVDDPDAPVQPTIEVTDSAVPGQLATTLRQVMMLAGGWAVGKGYLDSGTLGTIVTLSGILAPVVWGQFKQWRSHQDKRALAISAPIGKLK